VADEEWKLLYPGAVLQNLDFGKADHRPILIDTEFHNFEPCVGTKPRRFEAKWLKERGFAVVVQRAWERASAANPGEGVLIKLAHLHSSLHAWDEEVLKKQKKRLKSSDGFGGGDEWTNVRRE
jgi:hypothetical protein